MHELASLIDPFAGPPGSILPPGHPFTNVQSLAGYWSASTDAGTPSVAWFVNFHNGVVNTLDKTIFNPRVWCVRGGMNADQY